jgi:hypothetical protein
VPSTAYCYAELAFKQGHDYTFRIERSDTETGFRTAQSYTCYGTNLPQMTNVANEYHYLIASAWGTGSKKPRIAIFSYRIKILNILH